MDNKTATPAPKPDDAPKPAAPSAPVMDVVAPPPAPDPAPAANGDDKPHDPPPAEPDHQAGPDEKKPEAVKPAEVAPPPKPVIPKQPGSGIGMAIFGTVVIVLALAGLAVYAYLKSKN
jgi:hypothetical protein